MTAPHDLTMSSEAMPLGHGVTIVFKLSNGRLDAEWSPRVPVGRKARRHLAPYRLARDEFLRRVALRTGLTVGVVEV